MDIAIIGNGICGITAAKTINELSPKDRISILTDEAYHYYPRPLLDRLLCEKIDLNRMFPYDDEWFKKKNIEVRLKSGVLSVDTATKTLQTEGAATYRYDKLLFANGSSPFVPSIDGITNEGVFTYRNIADVLRIRAYARGKKKAVVIGGGLLGLETARALAETGLKVAVIEHNTRLLPRQLDDEAAQMLRSIMERFKIEVVLSASCDRIILEGRKKCLLMKDSEGLEADLFIISAGIRPNLEPARSSGIIVNKGIVVDSHMRTNAPDVFAAGDCAEHNGIVYGIIPAAIDQGRAAAYALVGSPLEYRGTTFQTTLKVVGIDLTSIGEVNPAGEGYEEVRKKDAGKGIYRKVVIKDGRAIGAIALGDKRGIAELTTIIKDGIDVSRNKDALMADGDVLREKFLKK